MSRLAIEYGQEKGIDLFNTPKEDFEKSDVTTEYIVQNLIPADSLLLLTGPPKEAGKTTFALHLSRAVSSGASFLGKETRPNDVLFLTEQPKSSFRSEYIEPCGLKESSTFHYLEYGRVAGRDWDDILEEVSRAATDEDAGLLVVDTFLTFAGLEGEEENASGPVKNALSAVKDVCLENDMTGIVVHHDRKSGGSVIEAGRGSSAFAAIADHIFNLTKPGGNRSYNIRHLKTAGRFSDIPIEERIALEEDGYRLVGDSAGSLGMPENGLSEAILDHLPEDRSDAVSRDELLEILSENGRDSSDTTLHRRLEALEKEGSVECCGEGTKGDPHRYYLV